MKVGDRLGNYEVQAPLGAGGMGEVYRAKDLRLGREVAIKVLSPAVLGAEGLKRFEREAKALAALNHPNVAVLYGIEEIDNVTVLVMELVRGESLAQRLSRGALPTADATDIARQIAAGLASAHQSGIVHRDLKPANVMLTTAGEVKLVDFGLSQLPGSFAADEETGSVDLVTRAGTVVGTAPYMSPEQVSGERVDARSDIWSFGCVFFEMLTGTRAFGQASFAATAAAILHRDPDWSRLPSDLPDDVAGMIRRCLEKNLDQRLPSMTAAQRALERSTATPAPSLAARRPVRRAALLAVLAAASLVAFLLIGKFRQPEQPVSERPDIRSIAVLPMDSHSAETGQDYFADGMTEALINDLSALGLWRVTSRTSAMHYKGRKGAVREIARELDVDAVLEGSVLRAGDRVRITARLVHPATDEGLWTGSYEREIKDILALQREVASAVATELKGRLTEEQAARLPPGAQVNPEAHLLYMQARFLWNERTPKSVEQAIRYFDRALERDATHAASHAGLAESYVLLAAQGIGVWRPVEAFPKTKEAARRALALDESLPGAHAALGYTALLWDWDWAASEKAFTRAIELNPSYANGRFWYGAALASRGKFEDALHQAKQAVAHDPVSPIIVAGLAWVHQLAGDHDAVIDVARKALQLNPTFPMLHHRIGVAYGHKGLHEDAIRHHREAVKASGESPDMLAQLGYSLAVAGKTSEARDVLQSLEALARTRYVSAFSVAIVHLGLGDHDAALAMLEKATEEKSWYLPFIGVDPLLEPLRGHPRFQRILATLRLEGLPLSRRAGASPRVQRFPGQAVQVLGAVGPRSNLPLGEAVQGP